MELVEKNVEETKNMAEFKLLVEIPKKMSNDEFNELVYALGSMCEGCVPNWPDFMTAGKSHIDMRISITKENLNKVLEVQKMKDGEISEVVVCQDKILEKCADELHGSGKGKCVIEVLFKVVLCVMLLVASVVQVLLAFVNAPISNESAWAYRVIAALACIVWFGDIISDSKSKGDLK